MKPATEFYLKAWEAITTAGWEGEIEYVRQIKPFDQQEFHNFEREYVWVVLNAGMKEQIARKTFDEFWKAVSAYAEGISPRKPFAVIGHEGKRQAILLCAAEGRKWFELLKKAENKIDYLETLPWIGKITKYHLARNLGIDTVKPDRHLVRLAERFGYASPLEMCKEIQDDLYPIKEKLGVIDVILWRYCNLGGCEKL